jgi:hypothetical protein
MLTPNQVHAGQQAEILAVRQARQAQALDHRRDARHTPFTLEELIVQPLPDISQCPVYSWAGRHAVPQNTRHPLRN